MRGMTEISIVPAGPDDCQDVYDWRNDPASVKASKNPESISWTVHSAWYEKSLLMDARRILIGYFGETKVGSVRLDEIPDRRNAFLISIMVAPSLRGRGIGAKLLSAAISHSNGILEAEILPDNSKSQRIFERCGFSRVESNDDRVLRYRLAR
jgi:RimJ/RimL family protein N-acetyltransferase